RPAPERRSVMGFSSWLRNGNRSDPGKRVRAQISPRKRAAYRPALEALEDRSLPSTLTVLNAADSGPGSLRAEIAAAKNGDTIVFDPSLGGQQIVLTSGQLRINRSLTIQGLPEEPVISGGFDSRVFEVAANTSVTLTGLTIIDGVGWASNNSFDGSPFDGRGGGVLNLGTLTLNGCTLSG